MQTPVSHDRSAQESPGWQPRFADFSDPDLFRQAVQPVFGDLHLELPRSELGFQTALNIRYLRDTAIYQASYAAPMKIRIANASFIAQGVTLNGSGSCAVNGSHRLLSTDDLPAPVMYASDVELHFGENHRHIAFAMNPEAVARKLTALTGIAAAGHLRVTSVADFAKPESQAFRGLIALLAEQVVQPLSPVLLEEFEQSLIVSFLLAHQHNWSHLLSADTRDSAPWQVRRAEDYIAANWDKPLTVEALAAEINTTVRSLYHSFKKSRGQSPMEFVRLMRLRHARARLQALDAAMSVTEVAYSCGFGNLGHFAKLYFREFHEHPSETLRRTRSFSQS